MVCVNRCAEVLNIGRPWRGCRRLPNCDVVGGSQLGLRFDARPGHGHDAGEADSRRGKTIRQRPARRDRTRQFADGWSSRGHHHLRARVEAAAGVVQRVDRCFGVEVAVATPVDSLQEMSQKSWYVVSVEVRGVSVRDQKEIFCQRELSLAEDRSGLCEQFGRTAGRFPRHVAFAPDSQEQWMYAGGIHRVDAVHARKHGWDHRACEFVHEPAEECVFLRRSTNHRHRPDCPPAMPNMLHVEHGEIVLTRVVAQVVPKGSLGLGHVGDDRSFDDKVGFGIDGGPIVSADHWNPVACEHSCKRQFREALGQRHHRRHRHGWRATHKNGCLERFAAGHRRCVMHADTTVQLIVQAHLAALLVRVARQLHSVHPEVGSLRSWMVWVFGVDRRERDKRAAITGPTRDLRQVAQRNLMGQHGSRRHASWKHRDGIQRRPPVTKRPPHRCGGINFKFDQSPHAVKRIGKNPFDPPLGTVEIYKDWKGRALGAGEEHRRATGSKQPPLDLGDLQVRIDRSVDCNEFAGGAKSIDTGSQRAKSHSFSGTIVASTNESVGCDYEQRNATVLQKGFHGPSHHHVRRAIAVPRRARPVAHDAHHRRASR